MAITTSMSTSFKVDMLFGRHHFAQSRTFTATGVSTQTWTGLSSLVGLSVGNTLSGANVAAGTKVADILSSTSIFVSKASTGAIGTVTNIGDTFKIALIKPGMAGTYNAASTSYANITGNTDETTGTGYTAGGANLTNVDPTSTGTTAFTDFSPDPSWTSASFSTAGCMLYNSTWTGPTQNPSCSVHDFGGTQTVASGTFTAVMPVADSSNAILRIA